MAKIRTLSFLALVVAPLLSAAYIVETPSQILVSADFATNGRMGLVAVDRVDGTFAVADAAAGGDLVWRPRAYESGLSDVAAAATGRFFPASTGDFPALALTAPFANRAQVFDLRPFSPVYPRAVPVNSLLGPSLLATIDNETSNAPEALALAAVLAEPTGHRLGRIGWNGFAWRQLPGERTHPDAPVRVVSLPDALGLRRVVGLLHQKTTVSRVFTLHETGGPLIPVGQTALSGLPVDSDLRAIRLGPDDWIVRFATAGSLDSFHVHPWVNGALGAAAPVLLGASVTHFEVYPSVDRVYLTGRLAGGQLRVWEWIPQQAPVPAVDLSPAASAGFLGILPLGPEAFRLLRSAPGGDRLASVERFDKVGTNWKSGGVQPVPPVSRPLGGANVLFFSADPLRDPDARLLRGLRLADWSVAALDTGAKVLVSAAHWEGTSLGIGSAQEFNIGAAPAGTEVIHINQMRPDAAISTELRPLGDLPRSVRVEPAGGEYDATVFMSFSANPANSTVRYRAIHEAAWTNYTPGSEIPVFADTTILFVAEGFESPASPIGSVTYTFSTPPEQNDANFDGVPDFVKSAFGLDPQGAADGDGDGVSDLIELLAALEHGLDPAMVHDASAQPTNQQVEALGLRGEDVFSLGFRPLSPPPVTPFAGGDMASSPGGPLLPPPTQVFLHTLDGRFMGSALTTSTPDGVTARIPGLFAFDSDLFLVAATDAVFQPNAPEFSQIQPFGRQLLALVPAPQLPPRAFSGFIFGQHGGLANLPTEAIAWLQAYLDWRRNLPPQDAGIVALDVESTLHALLNEFVLGQLLYARRNAAGPETDPRVAIHPVVDPDNPDNLPVFVDPLAAFPVKHITLTGFRENEFAVPSARFAESVTGDLVPDVMPTAQQIKSLRWHRTSARPAIAPPFHALPPLEAVRHGVEFSALRDLARRIYRLSAQDDEARLRAPVDTLRHFIRTGDLPTAAWIDALASTPGGAFLLADAWAELNALLPAVPARIIDEFYVVHVGGTAGETPFRRVFGYYAGMTLADYLQFGALHPMRVYLIHADGTPYRTPTGFNPGAGTFLHVRGYRDFIDFDAGVTVLEVIEKPLVAALPKNVIIDVDAGLVSPDLLDFYSRDFIDPFADDDGDGYTNLQEILAGSDPFSASSIPRNPAGDAQVPLDARLPEVSIVKDEWGYHYQLQFEFPPELSQDIVFALYVSTDLEDFYPTGETASWTGMGTSHSVVLPSPSGSPGGAPGGFYRLRLRLR
ncbi:MAG: hypothetical protein JJT96_05030 [Opitutales bacterium]|nr:hypothetical protein [Opitutales bacterium]